jgi:hypothetical protein
MFMSTIAGIDKIPKPRRMGRMGTMTYLRVYVAIIEGAQVADIQGL